MQPFLFLFISNAHFLVFNFYTVINLCLKNHQESYYFYNLFFITILLFQNSQSNRILSTSHFSFYQQLILNISKKLARLLL